MYQITSGPTRHTRAAAGRSGLRHADAHPHALQSAPFGRTV